MRAGRGVAFLAAVTAAWLAGFGIASADPSTGPTPAGTAVSSTPPAAPESPAAPTPTGTGTSSAAPAATTSPKVAPPNTVTATFSDFCSDYGWDVTNTTAEAVTVHVEVHGVQVGDAVVVPTGATVHVPLDPQTPPATTVALVDAIGTVISSREVRFCIVVDNISVTIAAGTTYTKDDLVVAAVMPPRPRHGVVTTGQTSHAGFLRYTPDPCFAGTDSFGYRDFIDAVQGVITVTVLPGACRITVHRSATDCATNTVGYTASNPYSLPAHLIESNSATPGTSKDLVLPAHHIMVISTVTLTQATTHAQVSFSVRDTTHTVLTDEITFPCPPPTSPSESPLAATGAAPTQIAAFGAGAVAIGVILTWMVRPRRVTTGRRPRP
jgi:hypothetical protein